ncbi:MAG: hypothetical protein JSW27_20170 [Phycisphaerales bacterium]|nr:MAG: hypothetical protein JSW27_20170 [Phycisphaerales bacterium]
MKRITVNNKTDIKQLLYSDCVLGIPDDACQSFGGFQLWWYDKQHDRCHCCQSRWADLRRRVEQCSLDKAARVLWHKRRALFLRGRRFSEDRKLTTLTRCCN